MNTDNTAHAPHKCRYCKGYRHEVRARTVAKDVQQFVWQCLDCGAAVSNAVPHSSVLAAEVPAWDEELYIAGRNFNDEKRHRESVAKRAEWFQQHSDYLRSDKWHEKRAAVLGRAKQLCEGCRAAVAVNAHHLTYAHWRDELLWELVAVCEACHERCHDDHLPVVAARARE